MTDRELLELAAKAADIQYDPKLSEPHENGTWWGLWLKYDREPHEFDRRHWNPLRDDGDALRLAIKLEIGIVFIGLTVRARAPEYWINEIEMCEIMVNDPAAKARRAIVRAAAEIGKAAA